MKKMILKYFIRIRQYLKTKYLITCDEIEVICGIRHPLEPPKRYNFINAGENKTIGKEFLGYFIGTIGLKSSDRILEIGSGFGRMAIPLTKYLSNNGSYDGLEIIRDGVNWCNYSFSPKFSNFNFYHIDVFNERYNPKGKYKGSEFKFNLKNDSYDFIFLTSVFTHMFIDDVDNYLSEISRMLKRNGKCLITFFLLNDESRSLIKKEISSFSFSNTFENHNVEDYKNPEFAIAYDEKLIRTFFLKHGIEIQGPIHYGGWSGRKNHLSFQDIIIGIKN